MSGRAVFLDRDGVLNVEQGYVTRPEDLRTLPEALAAVARLNRSGWRFFLFTNQACRREGLSDAGDFGGDLRPPPLRNRCRWWCS